MTTTARQQTAAPSAGIRYEDNEEFNRSLDEEHDDVITIAGETFRPSEILFRMAPEKYRIALSEFEDQQFEDFKERVCEEFPAPIAHCFRRFECGYDHQQQRLDLLRDTWEAIINLLFALAVGEARARKLSLAGHPVFRQKSLFTDKMAERISIVEWIIDLAAQRGATLNIARILPAGTLQQIRELNRARNGFAHRSAMSDRQVQTAIDECLGDVLEVLELMEDLAEVHLIRFQRSENGTTIRHECFNGHNRTRTFGELELTPEQFCALRGVLNCDHILAVVPPDAVFSLRPFIHYDDPHGHQTDLCVFKQRGSAVWSYEVCGESRKIEFESSTFQQDRDELNNLFKGAT
jgi:hypothetical protein